MKETPISKIPASQLSSLESMSLTIANWYASVVCRLGMVKVLLDKLRWFYATRLLGTTLIVFGVFGDKTPERSTIILTGAGLLGIDKVARSEPKKD